MKTKVISTHSHRRKEVAPMYHNHFIVPPGKKIHLKDYDPGFIKTFIADCGYQCRGEVLSVKTTKETR